MIVPHSLDPNLARKPRIVCVFVLVVNGSKRGGRNMSLEREKKERIEREIASEKRNRYRGIKMERKEMMMCVYVSYTLIPINAIHY